MICSECKIYTIIANSELFPYLYFSQFSLLPYFINWLQMYLIHVHKNVHSNLSSSALLFSFTDLIHWPHSLIEHFLYIPVVLFFYTFYVNWLKMFCFFIYICMKYFFLLKLSKYISFLYNVNSVKDCWIPKIST